MDQCKCDQQVSNKRGDHAEGKTLLRTAGHDAEGGHPGLGEEGGRVPCSTEEPQDQRGYKHGPVVDLVVQMVDGRVHNNLQLKVWVCWAANDFAAKWVGCQIFLTWSRVIGLLRALDSGNPGLRCGCIHIERV